MTGAVRYAEPRPFSEAVREAVTIELDNCRGATFRNAEARERFLRSVQAAIFHFDRTKSDPPGDRWGRREKVLKFAKSIGAARDLFAGLGDEREILFEYMKRQGPRSIRVKMLELELDLIETAALELAEDLKRSPGERDHVPGQILLFVSIVADAWRREFERAPSASEGGQFMKVLDAIFREALPGEKLIGREALKSLLNG